VGGVKGGTVGCGSVGSFQLSKHCALCKMEEHVFIVKVFYQTNFMTVQSFGGDSTGTSKICQVQQSELTDSVCDNKKDVVEKHRSCMDACMSLLLVYTRHCFGV
jgi:hypothetical protein